MTKQERRILAEFRLGRRATKRYINGQIKQGMMEPDPFDPGTYRLTPFGELLRMIKIPFLN